MNNKKDKPTAWPKPSRLLTLAVVAASMIGLARPPLIKADQFDRQIRVLQQQNDQSNNNIAQLEQAAVSYQDAIDRLQSQIDQVQQQVVADQAKQVDLQSKIDLGQLELGQQKVVLGKSIRAMYIEGQMTTIEMLASSKNLSEFADKKEYRTVVNKSIQKTVKQITDLQAQLKDQQSQVEKLIADQKAQQSKLNDAQTEQAKLLSFNTSQQTDYAGQVKNNQSKIADLRSQQARLIAQYQIGSTSAGNPDHGGYPLIWDNAAQDSKLDSWGMYNRECVSYTAFKVHQDYVAGKNRHDMPYWGGIGDAKSWPTNAQAAGIPVDNNPTVGSIAISTAGTWGHSMYVEAVGSKNGQPAIYVSQYNTDFTGHYSEGWRYTTGLVFIHF